MGELQRAQRRRLKGRRSSWGSVARRGSLRHERGVQQLTNRLFWRLGHTTIETGHNVLDRVCQIRCRTWVVWVGCQASLRFLCLMGEGRAGSRRNVRGHGWVSALPQRMTKFRLKSEDIKLARWSSIMNCEIPTRLPEYLCSHSLPQARQLQCGREVSTSKSRTRHYWAQIEASGA